MRRHQGAGLDETHAAGGPSARSAGPSRPSRRRWLAHAARAVVLAGSLGAAALAAAVPSPVRAQSVGPTTTVIVVRHGEKAAEPAGDPPLSEAGRARAEALWLALKDAGVQAVITTQLARTIQTAAPTARHLGLTGEVVAAGGTDHAKRVAALVMGRHAGQTVLVVGHSNTVPDIVAALGAPAPAPICDAVYDDFFVVSIGGDHRATVMHARYGAATPAGAGCGSMK